MKKYLKRFLSGWCAALLLVTGLASPVAAHADTITYYHNDFLGSPVVATNSAGAVLWRQTYKPYGERMANEEGSFGNKIRYTSRHEDDDTGLVYMGARYYDPTTARFISVDPQGFATANVHSFSRYAYANNNPYRYIDPDGRSGSNIVGRGLLRLLVGAGIVEATKPKSEDVEATQNAIRRILGFGVKSESAESEPASGAGAKPIQGNLSEGENANPYDGPIARPVIVVDPQGNAIPVEVGQRITTSPNGDYQQVRGSDGTETGVRLDRGGHKNRTDPRARDPHAHVPGVTLPDGNPHLPIRQP